MENEKRIYNICQPCPVSELGQYLNTKKSSYADKLAYYLLIPLFQPYGYNRITTVSSTLIDTDIGIALFAPPEISGIYPDEQDNPEALAVSCYQYVDSYINGYCYPTWEIRQYQTAISDFGDKRNRKFNSTLGFFDYKSALRDYLKQFARFNADQLGNVDFLSETIDYYGIAHHVYVRACEICGKSKPTDKACVQADYEIAQSRIQYLESVGFTEPVIKPTSDGSSRISAMAMWVGDIVPNESAQNTMAVSLGYPVGDYYRY